MDDVERYTEVERFQHITQTDTRIYGQSYVANTFSVSGRDAFLGEAASHDHVDFFQFFARFREKGLPNCLPAQQKDAIRQNCFIKLRNYIHLLKAENVDPLELKAASSKASLNYRSITAKRLQQYKLEWVRERRDWKIATRGKEQPDDDLKTDLLDILSRITPERNRLAKPIISDAIAFNKKRRQTVQDLYSLISRDCSVLYRPEEEPIDEICPIKGCGTSMIR